MGVQDPGRLSLGEWAAILDGWMRAHGGERGVAPPSEAEFEQAMLAARGVN